MKALKILGGIVLTLVLAVGVFYVGWMSPPPAEDVCDNMGRVFEKEIGSSMPDEVRDDCMKRASTPPEFGRLPWVAELKCVRDADSMDAIESCGGSSRL